MNGITKKILGLLLAAQVLVPNLALASSAHDLDAIIAFDLAKKATHVQQPANLQAIIDFDLTKSARLAQAANKASIAEALKTQAEGIQNTAKAIQGSADELFSKAAQATAESRELAKDHTKSINRRSVVLGAALVGAAWYGWTQASCAWKVYTSPLNKKTDTDSLKFYQWGTNWKTHGDVLRNQKAVRRQIKTDITENKLAIEKNWNSEDSIEYWQAIRKAIIADTKELKDSRSRIAKYSDVPAYLRKICLDNGVIKVSKAKIPELSQMTEDHSGIIITAMSEYLDQSGKKAKSFSDLDWRKKLSRIWAGTKRIAQQIASPMKSRANKAYWELSVAIARLEAMQQVVTAKIKTFEKRNEEASSPRLGEQAGQRPANAASSVDPRRIDAARIDRQLARELLPVSAPRALGEEISRSLDPISSAAAPARNAPVVPPVGFVAPAPGDSRRPTGSLSVRPTLSSTPAVMQSPAVDQNDDATQSDLISLPPVQLPEAAAASDRSLESKKRKELNQAAGLKARLGQDPVTVPVLQGAFGAAQAARLPMPSSTGSLQPFASLAMRTPAARSRRTPSPSSPELSPANSPKAASSGKKPVSPPPAAVPRVALSRTSAAAGSATSMSSFDVSGVLNATASLQAGANQAVEAVAQKHVDDTERQAWQGADRVQNDTQAARARLRKSASAAAAGASA